MFSTNTITATIKIEDELGIDLITYFKLFKTTKAWAYSNNGKHEVSLTGVNPYDKTVDLWNGVCHIENSNCMKIVVPTEVTLKSFLDKFYRFFNNQIFVHSCNR